MRLGRSRGVETRRRPCIVHVGDGYEVRYYKEKALITLVLILDIILLTIIYIVIYIYSKWLRVRCLIS